MPATGFRLAALTRDVGRLAPDHPRRFRSGHEASGARDRFPEDREARGYDGPSPRALGRPHERRMRIEDEYGGSIVIEMCDPCPRTVLLPMSPTAQPPP